ncbi:ASCH domain-containing protein [Thermoflavimicrobium daqui]|jgi:hypothetical protein|uniref:ASCH domain-containing protein n=1 Tax=Thermoflavimicrobium daqui TaxID=2137476 RepID=A0A364K3X0_9BACL|nr:ASCH domain-containing protein [Thermoflavimicrobium daqui]RAL24074.1 hypothetical protein DL897_10280 [Thermoflavimicrobium daqui]
MLKELPPKTCSIDRLITRLEDVQLVIQGKKIASRRNGRYADPGEIMELDGKKFEVVKVYQQSLGELTDQDAQAEGFSTVDSYKEYILTLHPKMPWLPQMKVWVHEFRPIT